MMLRIACTCSILLVSLAVFPLAAAAAPVKPPKEPARIEVAVEPNTARPGAESIVTVRLTPAQGIKINRYPKIRLKVEGRAGLVSPAEASAGNSQPPPPDQMESNYFGAVDPVEIKLKLDASASPGRHEISGLLSYYYCVSASGFCAPAKVPLTIPITVR